MYLINKAGSLRALPCARRFACALTANREHGDALVAEARAGELPDLPPPV